MTFGVEATVGLTYIVLEGNWGAIKTKGTVLPSETLSQTLNFADFRFVFATVR